MPEWIHAIIIGGGMGLFFAAREMEKWLKKSQEQNDQTQLTEFEKQSAYFAQQARQRTIEVSPLAPTKPLTPKLVFTTKTNLPKDVEVFRERYRRGLTGGWSTTEIIPMGCSYMFNENGTGNLTEYSGFGGWDIPFQWRCVDDLVIEIKFDYPEGYFDRIDALPPFSDENHEEEEDEDDEWERIEYDFILPQKGYCANEIVLCSAHDAKRYKENPDVIKDDWFGFRFCDGALTQY